jgi:hypothetical protein
MAYKLAIANVVDVAIKFKVQDGSVAKTHSFTLIGKRLSQEEVRAIGADHDTSVRDFLLQQVTGWRAQRLVVDDSNGEPVAFSPEAFECLLSLPGMELVAYRAYLETLALSDSREGREKK